jgi:hypothetical protein
MLLFCSELETLIALVYVFFCFLLTGIVALDDH